MTPTTASQQEVSAFWQRVFMECLYKGGAPAITDINHAADCADAAVKRALALEKPKW